MHPDLYEELKKGKQLPKATMPIEQNGKIGEKRQINGNDSQRHIGTQHQANA